MFLFSFHVTLLCPLGRSSWEPGMCSVTTFLSSLCFSFFLSHILLSLYFIIGYYLHRERFCVIILSLAHGLNSYFFIFVWLLLNGFSITKSRLCNNSQPPDHGVEAYSFLLLSNHSD